MPISRVVLLLPADLRPEYREPVARLQALLRRRGIEVSDSGEGVLAAPGALTGLGGLLLDHLNGNDRPCGLLNTGGYYSELMKTVDDGLLESLVRETQRGRLIVERDPEILVQAVADYLPPETRRQGGGAH